MSPSRPRASNRRRDPDPAPLTVCVVEVRDATVKAHLIALGVPASAIQVLAETADATAEDGSQSKNGTKVA